MQIGSPSKRQELGVLAIVCAITITGGVTGDVPPCNCSCLQGRIWEWLEIGVLLSQH